MTRDEAKKLLPIMKAYAEGKAIQIFDGTKYIDLKDETFFISSPDNYRIKPEPTYRPFKDGEECWQEMQKHQPFGWIKNKSGYNIHLELVNTETPTISTYHTEYNLSEAFAYYTFIDDTPFGIEVKEE